MQSVYGAFNVDELNKYLMGKHDSWFELAILLGVIVIIWFVTNMWVRYKKAKDRCTCGAFKEIEREQNKKGR